MSLAPGEQRTLTEIENQLRKSDPKFAAMFDFRVAGCVRPVMRPMQSMPSEWPGSHSRKRVIIMIAVVVTLVIASIALAVHSGSRAVPQPAGHGSGTGSSASAYNPAGR